MDEMHIDLIVYPAVGRKGVRQPHAVNRRPGGCSHSSFEACHKCPVGKLQEQEYDDCDSEIAELAANHTFRLGDQQLQGEPQHVAGQYHSRYEVRSKFDMINIQVLVVQSAGYHYPSYQPLENAEDEQDNKRLDHLFTEILFCQEECKADKKDNAEHPGPQPVKPLPEKDGLKI